MSLKEELIDELMSFGKRPNEFEKIIQRNKSLLNDLPEDELTKLNMMYKCSRQLCAEVPYKKEVIYEIVELGEVGLHSSVGELYNMMSAAEYIFEKKKENSNN